MNFLNLALGCIILKLSWLHSYLVTPLTSVTNLLWESQITKYFSCIQSSQQPYEIHIIIIISTL